MVNWISIAVSGPIFQKPSQNNTETHSNPNLLSSESLFIFRKTWRITPHHPYIVVGGGGVGWGKEDDAPREILHCKRNPETFQIKRVCVCVQLEKQTTVSRWKRKVPGMLLFFFANGDTPAMWCGSLTLLFFRFPGLLFLLWLKGQLISTRAVSCASERINDVRYRVGIQLPVL